MPPKLWEQVRDIVGAQEPVVLPSVARVVCKRQPGRPRKHPSPSKQFRHKMQTAAGWGMRCRWRGCDKILGTDVEDICCSPKCRELLREYCEVTLKVLSGEVPALDYPLYFRSAEW